MLKVSIFLFIFSIFMFDSVSAQTPPIEAGVSQKLAEWRAARYSDVRYKLNITLEKGAPVLKGTMEISVKLGDPAIKSDVVKDGSFQMLSTLPTIVLDWRRIGGRENLSIVSNVSINGKALVLNKDAAKFGTMVDSQETGTRYYFDFNEHLAFADGVKIGENIIKLDFTSPILTSGAAVTRYVDKEDGAEYVYSLFMPSDASTVFPVFDQPDLKARFKLKVIVPDQWYAISNTSSQEMLFAEEKGRGFGNRKNYVFTGTKEVEFEETKPISLYVFVFAAGDFVAFDEILNGKIAIETAVEEFDALHRKWTNAQSTKIYIRKSQAEKFKQHAAETFRLNREKNKGSEKADIVLMPGLASGRIDRDGLTFMRESAILR